MPPPKAVIRFFFILIILLVALLYPWSALERGYAAYFRAIGNACFSDQFWFWDQGRVHFIDLYADDLARQIDSVTPGTIPEGQRLAAPTKLFDTLMVVRNTEVPISFGQLRVNSRILGYWPTAMLLALVLAKPLPWERKAWAVILGLILIHLFIIFRLSLKIAHDGFGAGQIYAIFSEDSMWVGLMERLKDIFFVNPTTSFAVPALIFLLVSVTLKDWTALRAATLGRLSENDRER